MDNLTSSKAGWLTAINRRIETHLKRVAGGFDHKALNPPRELRIYPAEIPDEWIAVGYIPTPKTRLGWFTYHLIHGLAMRYPLRSVIAFALLHTNPYGKEVTCDDQKSDQANAAGSLAG